MLKLLRNLMGSKILDPSIIHNLVYNNASGAEKNTDVVRCLVPLNITGSTYTTDATTARVLPSKGRNIAVYNNSAAVHAITVGDDSAAMVALAAGVVDNATKRVGVACTPNDWTYIACNDKNMVISDSAALLVYLIEDDTEIRIEAAR